jgi:hypothetical protein
VEPSAVTFSRDETRALGFIALLLALSAGVRLLDRPRPLQLDAAAVDIGALEAASRGEAAAGGRPQPLGPGERIDPNTASREDLLRLPRMRPALADALIRAREAAPLQTLEDVDRVPGVDRIGDLLVREGLISRTSLPRPSRTRGRTTRASATRW